jgi:PIN domain nuclease of toxin-antitoxin system
VIHVSDTHSFLWYQTGQARRLGRAAARAFRRAERGLDEIRLSAVSVFEISLLLERGRLRTPRGWEQWISVLGSTQGLAVEPLSIDDVRHARALAALVDPFDRLIAATALRLDVPLITADERITASGLVTITWS